MRKRGFLRHLNIPKDLPLVALHKLHETPEYLSLIYNERGEKHTQVMKELMTKFE
jgi:hypothetical protein